MDTEHCHSCGSKNINLLGDNDKDEHGRMLSNALYGYLCPQCRRILEATRKDLARVQQVAAYIERSRRNPYATYCKACHALTVQSGSPRKREYCSDACKQRDYRDRHRNAIVTG